MQEFEFKNSFGDVLYGHKWEKEGNKKALAIITGMAEHSARYDDFANFLNNHGFNVYSIDHYGQGKNGTLGDPNCAFFMMITKTYKELIDSLKEQGYTTYLFGHSMGSFVAQNFVQNYGNEIEKVIICGSNGKTALYNIGYRVANIVCNSKNKNEKAKLLHNLSFSGNNKKFKKEGNEFAWLSKNKENYEKYEKDPLCGYVCTNGFYQQFMTGLHSLHNKKLMKQINKDLQILIIAGELDPVGNYSKGVKKLEKEYVKYGVKDVKCIIYKDLRHEILNEVEKDDVYKDILEFLEK